MNLTNRTGGVLLVDDEPFVLKLLSRQFSNLGFASVAPQEHAADALALLAEEPGRFGLICCDLQMPGTDGIEFVRRLAKIGYVGGLIFVSGEEDRVLQTAAKLAAQHGIRVIGALKKPVSIEQLKAVLHAHPPAGSACSTTRAPCHTLTADDLARAIRAGELVNHYQPKVELRSGRVSGVEALVRWQHPHAGLIYPDQFIGLAEECGLIDELTRTVLAGPRGALQQARAWLDAGLRLQIAVNVSMENLRELAFPDFVAAAAEHAGVAPSSLLLEVTESRLMSDSRATLDILTRLRLKRIGLAIDDFGTGHSSLTQLRDIPFDELKIDRSFVQAADSDPSSRAIVDATLGLAHQLGLKTVAEGVEQQSHWNCLRNAGCDIAQGYFIAPPMPGEQLAAWIPVWAKRVGAVLKRGAVVSLPRGGTVKVAPEEAVYDGRS